MWGTPFDITMLDGDIVVFCPNKELVPELLELFDEHGVKWGSGANTCSKAAYLWNFYKESTCYRVHNKSMGYGDKEFYESERRFRQYIKCTFYGTDSADSDVGDDEFMTILGIGGG